MTTGQRDIDYESLVQNAMRGIVRTILTRVAKSGLPGEHHFYIAFRTDAPGVSISKRLKEKYPEEMTIVLQHVFWDLVVKEDHFEVKLTFDRIAERLSVPFDAIKVFFDPSVPYGLQFEDFDISGASTQELVGPQRESGDPKPALSAIEASRAHETPTARADKKPRAPRRSQSEKTTERIPPAGAGKQHGKLLPTPIKPVETSPANGPKVVSIDAFRNKK
jgi:uncharacterized protein